MLLQAPSKRVFFALGTVVIFVLLCFRLDWRSQRPSLHGNHLPSLAEDINNSTLGFGNIFVVGLPSRSDRRDGMVLQAALSNLHIEFIDGVKGQDVPDNAIPTLPSHERLSNPVIGSWRAHMNAIREVVQRNLSSALILEDDTDWDVRIRQQLHDFALSSHALIQPLRDLPTSYADSTYPIPSAREPIPDISFQHLPDTLSPKVSPYGDDWDVLWLGHCGMHFPFETNQIPIPKGRVIHKDDNTVAQKSYLWTFNKPFTLKDEYPPHTRAVHHVQEGVCTLGYAVSQKGAQRLLYEVGLKDVSDAFDILLRFFCEGRRGRSHNCLTVQPALFHHHRPAGPNSAASDIGNHGDGFREKSMTDMVRWSVRLNVETILDGKTDFSDQYPDVD